MWSTESSTESSTALTRLTPHLPAPSLQHSEAALQDTDLSIRVIPALHILITALRGLQDLLDDLLFLLRGVELPQPSVREVRQEVSPGEDISPPEQDVNPDPCPVLGGPAPTPAPPSSHQPQFKSRQRRSTPTLTPN